MPMFPAWLEACVPLGIIATMVSLMGGLQGVVQKGFYGKPKAIGQDEWDRLSAKRDARITEEWQRSQAK
jgi:hypothetical protein